MLMQSDIKLEKMEENLENLMKIGLMTKSKILKTHFEVS